jgi:hypothetical protein
MVEGLTGLFWLLSLLPQINLVVMIYLIIAESEGTNNPA